MIRWINNALALVALYCDFIAFREARLNEGLAKQHRVLAAEIGLRLRMTAAMEKEAEAFLPASWVKQVVPVLYEVHVGTAEAWQGVDRGNTEREASRPQRSAGNQSLNFQRPTVLALRWAFRGMERK